MKTRVPTLAAIVLALAAQPPTAETPTPQDPYLCHFAAGPITVDGKLDEDAWERAEPITMFYALQPEAPTILSPTTARLLWDDARLYLSFECEDEDIWSYSNETDDELWNGDVVEFFVKPSRERLAYYEFVIAPNTTLFDGRYPSRGAGGYHRFKGWTSSAKVATVIDGTDGDPTDIDRGYTVEFAVPLAAFSETPKPAAGTTWTFCVFRYDYSKAYEDPLLLMAMPEAPAWGFHCYENYLPLRFEK
ncbi:MAG TPA: hypothetical protein ENN80_11630 [Candidatus Hydrogenedentes bacterium]|nr:hypothetical protein [Candidatus Hydrogenedentota bacterium]